MDTAKITFNNIDNALSREQYIRETFGEEIRQKMISFFTATSKNSELMSHFIPENSEQDVRAMFDEFIENEFSNLLPDEMEIYNVMSEPNIYDAWTSDIFNSLKLNQK